MILTAILLSQVSRLLSFGDPQIDESSGLAVSVVNANVIWTHNDSGDTARGFAIDITTGKTMAVLNVEGGEAVDWEDMAILPHRRGADLLFGDIGDNAEKRETHKIYRVPEPKLGASYSVSLKPSQVIEYRYPDGPHNAESLLVHPKTGRIYIISKRKDGQSGVYRLPRKTEGMVTAEKIADFPIEDPSEFARLITGAAISPDGRHVAVLTYLNYYEMDVPGKDFESVWKAPRRKTKMPELRQWEAITYSRDSKSVLIDSEGKFGPIFRVQLR